MSTIHQASFNVHFSQWPTSPAPPRKHHQATVCWSAARLSPAADWVALHTVVVLQRIGKWDTSTSKTWIVFAYSRDTYVDLTNLKMLFFPQEEISALQAYGPLMTSIWVDTSTKRNSEFHLASLLVELLAGSVCTTWNVLPRGMSMPLGEEIQTPNWFVYIYI